MKLIIVLFAELTRGPNKKRQTDGITMEMEPMILGFRLFPGVTTTAVVVSTELEATDTGGVLLGNLKVQPGSGFWATMTLMGSKLA